MAKATSRRYRTGNPRRPLVTDRRIICCSSLSVGSTKEQMQVMASQLIRDVARLLTPAPPVFDDEYDGLEFTWKFFVFRPGSEWRNHFINLSSSLPCVRRFADVSFIRVSSTHARTHIHEKSSSMSRSFLPSS
jgi:hypothetical protein